MYIFGAMNLRYLLVLISWIGIFKLYGQTESNRLYLKISQEALVNPAIEDSLQKLQNQNYFSSFALAFPGISDSVLQAVYYITIASPEYKTNTLKLSSQKSWIDYVEEIPVYELSHTPNDLDYRQWNLRKIKAELAWDDNRGDPAIIVAVIDDAVRLDHEDLAPVLWKNTSEIPGNGIDDDANGYIDDFDGWDFADGDNDPNPPSSNLSGKSHGTHCSGIVGAKTNNGLGIASLAYNIRIMPLKTSRNNSSGIGNTDQAIRYAVENGARVISMSWGGYSRNNTTQAILNYAYANNVVCIAAAGNSGSDAPMYPANYDHVISVGATDSLDRKATFSNFGARTDVMAPGVAIWSCLATSSSAYGYKSGTSMACPLVSSLAALMLSKDSLLTPDQVEACIKANAVNIDNLNPGYPGNLGAGRIDAEATIKICVKSVYARFSSNMTHVCPGGQVQFYDESLRSPTAWLWEFQGGSPATSVAQNPAITYSNPGTYSVKLKVSNAKGQDSLEVNGYITVGLPSAMLSGNYTIPSGYSSNLSLQLVGTAPWRVKLSNGTFSYWINNITSPSHYFPVTPQSTTTFTIDSVSDANCVGNGSGQANIIIGQINGGNCDSSTSTWQRRFKANGNEEMHNMISCVDGGYAMIGTTTSIGAGGQDVFLVRLNDLGTVVWAKSYGSTGTEKGYSIKVVQTTDSGFAITAVTTGFSAQGEDLYFLKLDKNGNIEKQKKLGGSGTDYGRVVLQTSDGNFLVGGTSGSAPKSGAQDAYVIKLDTAGDTLWTKKFGFAGLSTNHFISFQELPSGNTWLIGHGDHLITPYVGYIAKLSPAGAVLAEKRIYTSIFDAPTAATTLKNGNIALIGLNSSNNGASYYMQVLVIDTSGNVVWAKSLSNGGNIRATGGIATSDSGFVVTGYTNGFGNSNEAINVKFSANGAILWSRKFGSSGSEMQDGWSQCITEAPDGGLVFGLHTDGFNSSGKDLMMIKTNPCGFAGGCYESDVVFTVSNLNMTNNNVSAFKNHDVLNINVSSTTQSWTSIIDTSNFCPVISPSALSCNIQAGFNTVLRCAGETSNFNSTSYSQGRNIVYYKWDFGNGDTLVGSYGTANYIYPMPGNYNVRLIVGDNGAPACFDTIQKEVEIHNQLRVALQAEDTVCSSDTFGLGVQSAVCALGSISYHWSPSLNINDTTLRNPKASLQSSTWIKLTVIDSLGNRASDSVFVFVDGNCCRSYAKWNAPLPVICPGDSIEFVNESVSKAGVNYQWEFGSNASPSSYSGHNPPKVYFPMSGTYEVRLAIQDFCGVDTFKSKVYILEKPLLDNLMDTFICKSDSVEIFISSVSSYRYWWSPGNYFLDSTTNDIKVWVDSSRKFYYGITDYWSGCANSDSFSVQIEALDTLAYGLDTTLCYPNSVIIDYPGSGITALWSDGNSSLPRVLSDSGSYRVRLSRNNCSYNDTHTLNLLRPNLSLYGPDLLCKDDSGVYYINQEFSTMLWSTGSTDSFTVYSSQGYLKVTIDNGACSLSDSLAVERFNTPPMINADSIVCPDDSILLQTTYFGANITWSTGDTGISTWINTPGQYIVTVERRGCELTDTVQVATYAVPEFWFPNDTVLCNGDTVYLTGDSWPGSVYLWNDASNDTFNNITTNGRYWLNISNMCGSASDTFEIQFVDCDCISYIPSAFSPNNDDTLNGFFGPTYCPVQNFRMIIFNRWGEIIFESTDINLLWDGTYQGEPVMEGVFGYLIQYIDVKGDIINDRGNVTVLRPKR
ncbi:MAG: PKD domain-containing protein [Bacteroidetes bacterium]|nr:MAG: PKD domain-containing protein [Bacteroidota bacterium]